MGQHNIPHFKQYQVPIIGIIGKARSGKDTIANYLRDSYGIQRVAYADYLKKKVMQEFQLTEEQVLGSEKEVIDIRYNKTPRQILQIVGTDCYRNIDEDYWIKQLFNILKHPNNFLHFKSGIAVTDVRFLNEVQFVKDIGGKILKVSRDIRDEISDTTHTSETALDKFEDYDFEILNDGTFEELNSQVDKFMAEVMLVIK